MPNFKTSKLAVKRLIKEYEDISVSLPRYFKRITKFRNKTIDVADRQNESKFFTTFSQPHHAFKSQQY